MLVAGGEDSSYSLLSAAEIYDPTTGQWTLTGSLVHARELHTATLLEYGAVLITGGYDEEDRLSSTEWFFPGR